MLVKHVTRNGTSNEYYLNYYVQCDLCCGRGPVFNDKQRPSEEVTLSAIHAWNTRFPPKKRSKKEIIQRNQEIIQARKRRLLNKEKENEQT